ncbi:MAG: hypothetical protein ACKOUS_09045 [Alphaproteobacteria bacterium]
MVVVPGAATWPVANAQQADPDPADVLAGRWAVDPGDCQDNRYVWSFSAERAGLLVGNNPLGGWRKPAYAREGELLVVRMDGKPVHELRWRLVRDGELASAGVIVDGRVADGRSFLAWKRCTS